MFWQAWSLKIDQFNTCLWNIEKHFWLNFRGGAREHWKLFYELGDLKVRSVCAIIWTDRNTFYGDLYLQRGCWAKCALTLYSQFGASSQKVFVSVLLHLQPELGSTALPKHSWNVLCSQMTCISRPTRPSQPLGKHLNSHASLLFPGKDEGRVSPSLLHLFLHP